MNCYSCFFLPQVETRTLEEVHEVLNYASQTNTSLTRIMLDNMVVPLPNGDVDTSMLKEAVELINGRFETEVSNTVIHLLVIIMYGVSTCYRPDKSYH